MELNQENVYKTITSLEHFMKDHEEGEFEWNEVVNVFGPNEAKMLIDAIKAKDEIITRYTRIEQDLLHDCTRYEQKSERLQGLLDKVVSVGHDDDCMFCAMKDKVASKGLNTIRFEGQSWYTIKVHE